MYITVYTKSVKRRGDQHKTKVACAYSTKSLTGMHAHIRATYPGAKTYRDPARVITHFCLGIPLPEPIVSGGELIA